MQIKENQRYMQITRPLSDIKSCVTLYSDLGGKWQFENREKVTMPGFVLI